MEKKRQHFPLHFTPPAESSGQMAAPLFAGGGDCFFTLIRQPFPLYFRPLRDPSGRQARAGGVAEKPLASKTVVGW
jgi:hypothetical protein